MLSLLWLRPLDGQKKSERSDMDISEQRGKEEDDKLDEESESENGNIGC